MSLFRSSILPCSFFLLCSGGRWLKSSGPEPWEMWRKGRGKRKKQTNKKKSRTDDKRCEFTMSNFDDSLLAELLFWRGSFLIRCSISLCCRKTRCVGRNEQQPSQIEPALLFYSDRLFRLAEILQLLSNKHTRSRESYGRWLCTDLRPFTYSVALPNRLLSMKRTGNVTECFCCITFI